MGNRKSRKSKKPEEDSPVVIPAGVTCFVGIDGGVSGAIGARLENGQWIMHPVAVTRHNGRRKLDICRNVGLLKSIAADAGGWERMFVLYEKSGQNPGFGYKNAFVNGQNEEFWRVSLSLGGFQFGCVDPRTWHADCFKRVHGKKSKQKARNYVRKCCPGVQGLEVFTKAQQVGIIDAMCIALWGHARAAVAQAPAIAEFACGGTKRTEAATS
jgi:hypothetical protein